ncbi:major facilitator superfamily MFS_1 [Solidesulfovibrio carbinoliphilus subsp. oakridgensis]|uniref:Major facilitator superfamily MFS_1 n=1 Tax=Solidesulfovibrio carbinoliphilus subsp. oakridgensis TaxID=694327 RepID=G7QAV8_9BACT|nr:MFS transporter [Solidesulfovibrio carbinoliphilus]EHJ48299.1 major facilitator superfamily MFS_1 [Solidesulfovibrio carbinoliphilus subsp. oakridgensis]
MSRVHAGSPAMVLATVCIAQFMAPFMLTAVGVALPSLGRDLNATAMQLGLIEQLYVVSLAMGMLAFGRWGDIVGQRRVLLPGLAVFTALTCSLGFTQSVDMIMVQRFFQGLGACIVLSGSLALVAAAYPPELRGRKIGLVSACTYAGLSLGPVIGGFVTSHFGWRFVFLMSVPIGLGATGLCLFGMKEGPKNAFGERMDWRGGFFYAASVALVMLGAAHAKEVPAGPAMIAAGILGLAVFLRLQARTKSPLLDINLLTRNRFFTLSCLAALGNYAATFGITFMMSLYLQYAKGLPPRLAGFLLLFQPVAQLIASPLAGRLTERYPAPRLATIGMCVSSAGLLAAAATLHADTSVWLLGAELVVIGAGFGIFITPNSTAIMGSVQKRQFGLASGMIASMRTLGMAVSMTTVTLIFSLLMADAAITPATLPAFLTSMRVGLAAFAVFSCLGVILSFWRGKNGDRGMKKPSSTKQ